MDNSEIRIHFSDNTIEAAHLIIALSMFRSFREQGLLTEDEYKCFAEDGEKRWRNLLYDDSMITNRVV